MDGRTESIFLNTNSSAKEPALWKDSCYGVFFCSITFGVCVFIGHYLFSKVYKAQYRSLILVSFNLTMVP